MTKKKGPPLAQYLQLASGTTSDNKLAREFERVTTCTPSLTVACAAVSICLSAKTRRW